MENLEIWKPIVEYDGLYFVSNYGNVKSVSRFVTYSNGRNRTHKGKNIAGFTNKHGYKLVCIYKNRKQNKHYVHRLVAEAFIDNPSNKPQVNHVDANKSNNYYKNLEWSTRLENAHHAKEHNLYQVGEQKHNHILKETDVLKIINMLKLYKTKYIAEQYNVSFYAIHAIKRGYTWKHIPRSNV